MFTIKHVDPEGNEFAIEAESYEIQWDRENDLVRVMTYDLKYKDGNYTGLWVGVPPRGTPSLSVHRVFIMNRYGSTVSTIYYNDIPPDHFSGAGQVVEEKLAA